MKQKVLSFILAAVLCCTSNVWAGELTVANGTNASADVPFSGQFGKSYQRTQIIYPQSELAEMAGKDITSLTFYVKNQAPSALGVTVQIGLAEISDSYFSEKAYKSATLTIVKAEDVWDLNAATVVVEFSEPFSYSGEGSILFDIQTVATGSDASTTSFYGTGSLANYQSAYGYTPSSIPATPASRSYFIPKTTFTYEEPAPAGPKYDLTLADVSSDHGTVAFTVGGNAATQAKKDDVVTVSVTPDEGYSAKDVTVRAYTSWEAAGARSFHAPALVDDIAVTKQEDGTWTFAMPEASVWVTVTYAKNLQDAWIEAIDEQTYTGEAIEPTVTVQDGSAVLTLNTDYTVAYSNNTNAGTATVTVTAVAGSNYSGTATATFAIQKADITMTTAPAAVSGLVYSGEAQTLITAGASSFGTVLYSLDGENFSDALPQGTDAGTYTVTYKVEGDDNHNAFAAQTLNVTIATDKTALNNAITEAEAYYNSISESNPDAAAALQTAINTAKGVQGNADATQSEIESAAQTLNEAVDAAKADVALKRITLTIPAKSYMARIDEDKRQIETAVAGVKLFSVNNVTNTEVVLTGELGVIAAEMPYFIYNAGDTEVEVSIVVSSEDADNVDYDSEHFKGTLVDKTFTDEDMEEYDHYVLSGGSSFVWVKDAGTLSAGKCWIQLPKSPNNARALSIVFDGETTGISTAKTAADTKDAAVYDLQGRRVMQPTKGLFIVNGKKVVIK